MLVTFENVGDVTIVQLSEKLNSSNTQAFQREVNPLMKPNARLIFELSQVKQIDSAGLGTIISCLRELKAVGGDLKLCGMSKHVRTLFELVRMHHLFDIYNTKEEAIAAYK